MATAISRLNRPPLTDTGPSRARRVGLALAVLGLALVIIAFFGNLAAVGAVEPAGVLAWTFGLTTAGFGAIKLGIAVVLVGIISKLWARVGSLKEALPLLRADNPAAPQLGEFTSPHGKGVATAGVPEDLPIHTMAQKMWAPMLAMGAMAVVIGLVISFVWAGDPSNTGAAAWTQGLQFLGEALLLSGISFVLGTILWALRTGGSEVQESLGLAVKTLAMPRTGKVFVALMMLGLVFGIVQFVLYVVLAGGAGDPTWFVWLGPLREVALGLLLAGIVMALITIGNVLAFQFDRVKEICVVGR